MATKSQFVNNLSELEEQPPNNSDLYVVDGKEFPTAYNALKNLCMNSQGMDFEQIKQASISILNKSHSLVQYGGKVLVSERTKNHRGEVVYNFCRVEQLRILYGNLNFEYQSSKSIKKANCFTLWLDSLERKTYHGVVFDPSGKNHEGLLNLWSGFPVEPIEGDDKLDRIMWHFKFIICSGNDFLFNHFLAQLAHLIQKPAEKTGVSIVLKSEARGAGKNTVSKLVEELLGEHCTVVQDPNQLLGRFNAHLANKLFVIVEEAFFTGDSKDVGKFKTLITESSIVIEGKGRDTITIPSYHRFMLLSNNDWVVPQTANERRFFVLDISEEMVGNKEYFDNLYNDINDPEAIGQLFNFLQNYDISRFNLRKAPYTEATQKQVVESYNLEQRWLDDLLERGYLVSDGQELDLDELQMIRKGCFYNDFLDYCTKRGIKGEAILSRNKLLSFLVKVLKLKDGTRPSSSDGRRRPRTYALEPLEVLRERFNEHHTYK